VESVVEFFFKYRPLTFEKGDFAFGAPPSLALVAIVVAIAAAATIVTYSRVHAKTTTRDRVTLGLIRGGLLALLLFCLFRPMLLVPTAVPQRNFVGVLVDDSRSMQIADMGGTPRADVVRGSFGADGATMKALADNFQLRSFAFGSTAERVPDLANLTFSSSQTRLGPALDRVRQELRSVPLSGIVLVSDGADNARGPLTEQILALKAQGVPVFTVGVGRERFAKDIEIARVEAPRTALKGASVIVDLLVTQRGYGGRTVPLIVEDAGRIVSTQDVVLPADGQVAPVRVHVTTTEAGARTFNFRIDPQDGEQIVENNHRDVMIAVSDRREKILYFEGEPRHEVAFLRRAVADDPNLQLVLLQRTAERKFYRANVEDSEDLIDGFPRTREELFQYRAIILGSVEASYFTLDQLQMISEFVSERGGGLLMLGGRLSFAEGGYSGTPLADVLPVLMETAPAERGEAFFSEFNVVLTPAGMIHAATRIAPTEEESAERWRRLPPVSAVNRINQLKPGAVELVSGTAVEGRARQVVLAFQRYGRGRALAMPIQDSWIWKMHADIPVEDETHETLWRQVTRWLVSGVPGAVTLATSADNVAPREAVALRAEVTDRAFVRLNDARVMAHIMNDDGPERTVQMDWSVDRDGEYRATFTPDSAGMYRIRTETWRADTLLGSDTAFVRVEEPRSEWFGGELNSSLLKRIAEETGGRYYEAGDLSKLAEDLSYTRTGVTVTEQHDLWDMPIIFIMLLGLLGAEWWYRRMRGLA
jgi:uncharacterized membrane protein